MLRFRILPNIKKTYRSEVVVFDKNFNFYQKQQFHSKKALSARLLSVAKNSALCIMSNNRALYILKLKDNTLIDDTFTVA